MAHGDIARCYADIFEHDPLLLADATQARYSAGILKHLLVDRTINTLSPSLVDLHDEASRERFRRAVPRENSCPSLQVIARYRQSRERRTALDKDERGQLQDVTMACRGEYTAKRATHVFPSHDAAVEMLKESASPIAERLRIAAVCYRVQISKAENRCDLGEELCALPQLTSEQRAGIPESPSVIELGRTVATSPATTVKWEQATQRHVDAALARESHFIVFPEFALPPETTSSDPTEVRLKTSSSRDGVQDHFMFAGSRHDGTANRGLVISRSKSRVSDPWWHYKVAPARGLGENILGPYGTRRPSYAAEFFINAEEEPTFPIEIAICYDTFDPTVFLSLIVQSFASTDRVTRPRVILVPSFNTSVDFVALLRDLSFLSRSIVVYVNGLHGEAKLYICGFPIVDFMEPDKVNRMRHQLRERARELRRQRQELVKTIPLPEDVADQPNRLDWRITALKSLEQSLADLQRRRALDAVMTLDGDVGADVANENYHKSDLLYYNVDMGLVDALSTFRAAYFENDLFLPQPFHFDQLEAAVFGMQARQKDEDV